MCLLSKLSVYAYQAVTSNIPDVISNKLTVLWSSMDEDVLDEIIAVLIAGNY